MIFSGIATFGSNAVQAITAITDPNGNAWPTAGTNYGAYYWYIQPLRGNGAACWIGFSNVTNNGTGASMAELAAPVSNVALDHFEWHAESTRSEDPSILYVHGTSGQKVRITLWSN